MLALKNYAQENPTPAPPPPPINNQSPVAPKDFNSFKERLYVGGNGGMVWPSTYINISPLVGCKVAKNSRLVSQEHTTTSAKLIMAKNLCQPFMAVGPLVDIEFLRISLPKLVPKD
ncbi:MAG: hypothetical protein IPH32_06135 [Bacteroidetes bacterium]|nr:hypothetical protein [Bacteroidota bacterium]